MSTRDEFYQEGFDEDTTALDSLYEDAEQAGYDETDEGSTYYGSDFDDDATQLDKEFEDDSAQLDAFDDEDETVQFDSRLNDTAHAPYAFMDDETTQMGFEYDPLFDDATTHLDAHDAPSGQPVFAATDPTEIFQAQAQAGQSRFSRAGIHGEGGNAGRRGEASWADDAGMAPGYRQTVMPKKRRGGRIALIIILAIVVLVGAVCAIEAGFNYGRVHRGVSVSGVDVGGLSIEEATTKLNSELNTRLASANITVTPTAAGAARWLATTDLTQPSTAFTDTERAVLVDLKEKQAAGTDITSQLSTLKTVTWDVTQASVGATVNGATLANQAYEIGRSSNIGEFLSQRFHAWFGGIALDVTVAFDDASIEPLAQSITDSVGIAMVNYNIAVAGGVVKVTAGSEGECVNLAAFKDALSAAFLDTGITTVEAPMEVDPVDINADEATAVATKVTEAIASSVTLSYSGQIWEAGTVDMGSWISTRVEGTNETAVLVPYINELVAIPGMQAIMGSISYGDAVNASFDVSSGTPVVVPSQGGSGPDMKTGVADLNTILFGGTGAMRTVTFVEGTTQPRITTADAEAMGIKELIVEYTLDYGSDSGSNREYNIERALSFLNGSIVAPGENWEWNTVVGNCSYATGFKEAGVIENGQSTTGAGGGICNVATGVFNTAYEAGLPIVERSNHSHYLPAYPLGRDAAVSWPSPTLIFKNDYASYILLTATWDGYNMYLSIWGTSEGRTVSSTNSSWSYGSSGQSITNFREVRNAAGAVIRSDEFFSYYSFES